MQVHLTQMANAMFNGDKTKAIEYLKNKGIKRCDMYISTPKAKKKLLTTHAKK